MAFIQLENVSLEYPIYGTSSRSLKNTVIHLATGGRLNNEEKIVRVEALKNIHLKLENGDRLGLIGHNGAGKTTLLKVLAQIFEPTKGLVKISGKTNCLFDIMVGMDTSLSGYDNIFLRGLILGYSKDEIKKAIPLVEEFAELGAYIRMPLKSYSSGMLLRLAFGIITSIGSEILLIDEIVNVGDSRFLEKAKARMASLIHQSDIMVLSTHDNNTIKEFCNKAVWLEKGEIKFSGTVDEVLDYKSIHEPQLNLSQANLSPV
jgi:ABC-type polysaccharide/polyol phosphate transport system ATPase subunit